MRFVRARIWMCWLIMLATLFAACDTNDSVRSDNSQEADLQAGGTNNLSFYNWDTYIDPEILTDFEAQFNIAIDYQIFDSDNDMLEELKAGATDQYDLVVPSDVTVTEMRNESLLAPLDKSNIPNFENVGSTFVSPVFDPGNRYCAPYQWGTVGIGYNSEATGREIEGWSDFFDPAFAGRVALLDDYRTTLGLVLIYLGYSPNTTNKAQIDEATEFLKSQSDQIGGYLGDDAQDHLQAGDYDLVMEWSGDVFQVIEENPNIQYVIPAEGSIIWVDNICIPVDAPNKHLAELFINYLLEPEVGGALSNYVQYGSPNQASLPFIDEEILNDPAIYPTDAVNERLFFLVDVGVVADSMYMAAWDEILGEQNS